MLLNIQNSMLHDDFLNVKYDSQLHTFLRNREQPTSAVAPRPAYLSHAINSCSLVKESKPYCVSLPFGNKTIPVMGGGNVA